MPVGPGGIDKTTVATAVAGEVASTFRDSIAFVDFAPVANPRLVPSALTAVLGLESHSEDQLPGLIALLKDKQALLVLDSCEHVIDIAAALVEKCAAALACRDVASRSNVTTPLLLTRGVKPPCRLA